LHGIGTVGLEDANRSGCANAKVVKKDHDLAHDLLLRPGVGNALGPLGPMPVTSRSRPGFASITSKTL
jgi:hypothetical protein